MSSKVTIIKQNNDLLAFLFNLTSVHTQLVFKCVSNMPRMIYNSTQCYEFNISAHVYSRCMGYVITHHIHVCIEFSE